MKTTLKTGIERTEKLGVDKDRTIAFLGEQMRVYSTPSMVSDIEYACYRLLLEHLDESESSVGIHVCVDHLGATPLNASVEVIVSVTAVDGRKVSFDAEVHDSVECVGTGRHVRFVIDVARQAERLKEKSASLARGGN